MQVIMFSKMLKDRTVRDLVDLAKTWGLDGYDLCVRPGYAVSPENAAEALPKAADFFRSEGLDIPMVTGNFDLLEPDHPTALPILRAMQKAGIGYLKLGYFKYDAAQHDYLAEIRRVRGILARWEAVGRDHQVRICYHTHSNKCMGLNGAAMAHLLEGFDPAWIGAYIDPAHLVVEGEDIAIAVGMVRPWLSLVAVKDVLLRRVEKNGHGSVARDWVVAGEGCVDWTVVFDTLRKVGYDAPVSVHCEFKVAEDQFLTAVEREVGFFRRFVS